MKLETLYYQLVKKSDPPHGVLGHGKNALYYIGTVRPNFFSGIGSVFVQCEWAIITTIRDKYPFPTGLKDVFDEAIMAVLSPQKPERKTCALL